MNTMWFVLITIILAQPVTDGSDGRVGDVLQSSLMGAAETEEKCEVAGHATASVLERHGKGSVRVVWSCVDLPAHFAEAQDFKETETNQGDDK